MSTAKAELKTPTGVGSSAWLSDSIMLTSPPTKIKYQPHNPRKPADACGEK
jgi:hypothetical protein